MLTVEPPLLFVLLLRRIPYQPDGYRHAPHPTLRRTFRLSLAHPLIALRKFEK